MDKVFALWHLYELDEADETKFIGLYSTREKAERIQHYLRGQPGFKDYPDCFEIHEQEIDPVLPGWPEGFVTGLIESS